MNKQYNYDPQNKIWHDDCCNRTCQLFNSSENEAATPGDTIVTWNWHFKKRDKFQHPNSNTSMVHNGKVPEPSLFGHFQESKNAITKRFANGNLMVYLTMEFLWDFIITYLFVKLLKDIDNAVDDRKELLEYYKEKPSSRTTLWQCWIGRLLGYKYFTPHSMLMVSSMHGREEQQFIEKSSAKTSYWSWSHIATNGFELPRNAAMLGRINLSWQGRKHSNAYTP